MKHRTIRTEFFYTDGHKSSMSGFPSTKERFSYKTIGCDKFIIHLSGEENEMLFADRIVFTRNNDEWAGRRIIRQAGIPNLYYEPHWAEFDDKERKYFLRFCRGSEKAMVCYHKGTPKHWCKM